MRVLKALRIYAEYTEEEDNSEGNGTISEGNETIADFSAELLFAVHYDVVDFREWIKAGPANIVKARISDAISKMRADYPDISRLYSDDIEFVGVAKQQPGFMLLVERLALEQAQREAQIELDRQQQQQQAQQAEEKYKADLADAAAKALAEYLASQGGGQ